MMTILSIYLLVQAIEVGGIMVGGIIVLGFVWGKIRPIIVIRTDKGVKFFFGVSHSKKRKNMTDLSSEGIEGMSVDKDTCYGLCNTPSEIFKEIGTISVEKAEEIIKTTDRKKIEKKEKRNKK